MSVWALTQCPSARIGINKPSDVQRFKLCARSNPMTIQRPVQAVIFDLDGTVLDTGTIDYHVGRHIESIYSDFFGPHRRTMFGCYLYTKHNLNPPFPPLTTPSSLSPPPPLTHLHHHHHPATTTTLCHTKLRPCSMSHPSRLRR